MPRKKKAETGKEVRGDKRKRPLKKNMPRAVWSGAISFGLVNIPVKMVSAVRPQDLRFHMLHANDKARIENRIFCTAEGREIAREETVKGYEIGPGQHVIVRPEELEAAAPKASRTVEIFSFVKLPDIDPLYFDRPYYLVPEETARKAYALFLEALGRSGKVGLAKLVMRNKEYLAALRPLGHLVCLETMNFADEVVSAREMEGLFTPAEAGEREIKTAQDLIESLAGDFEPEKLRDEYREKVMDLIRTKAEGREIAVAPGLEERPEVVDLMAALEASLSEAKKRKKKAA